MRIAAVETSVVSLPFSMGGLHPLFAGRLWNRMEILAIAPRIRHVINGKLVADWSDPMPETCVAGPIGLQLHSNKVAQEVQWKGLLLTENPEDVLISVED